MIVTVDMAQQPIEDVKHHHGARIAEMRPVINRGSTDIHPHITGIDGLEHLFAAGLGILERDLGHRDAPLELGLVALNNFAPRRE